MTPHHRRWPGERATNEPRLYQEFLQFLRDTAVSKVEVSAKLCTTDGLRMTKVARRDKAAYAEARRWRWGEAVIDQS